MIYCMLHISPSPPAHCAGGISGLLRVYGARANSAVGKWKSYTVTSIVFGSATGDRGVSTSVLEGRAREGLPGATHRKALATSSVEGRGPGHWPRRFEQIVAFWVHPSHSYRPHPAVNSSLLVTYKPCAVHLTQRRAAYVKLHPTLNRPVSLFTHTQRGTHAFSAPHKKGIESATSHMSDKIVKLVFLRSGESRKAVVPLVECARTTYFFFAFF